MLGDRKEIKLRTSNGRYYIESHKSSEDAVNHIENCLSHLVGISGWAKTTICAKTTDDIIAACIEEGKKLFNDGIRTFKINSRRTDKGFPLDSYQLCCLAGEAVLKALNDMKVDIHNPQNSINIEIREKAYIYSAGKKGIGGLPAGTAGKGLLLLSGGIDSPVAGFRMISRGMSIDAVHFHSYPYTSNEAKQKAIDLAHKIGLYGMGIKLYIINFTAVQQRIKERAPSAWTTVLLRMAMMETSEKIANIVRCKCLITGESLSQVASQTIENLSCTESRISLPVLRPLIGFNKEQIIIEARELNVFEISIKPFPDCCMLFSPEHPVLYGSTKQANSFYEALEITPLIEDAIANYEIEKCGFWE